jgi:hypothetical protein
VKVSRQFSALSKEMRAYCFVERTQMREERKLSGGNRSQIFGPNFTLPIAMPKAPSSAGRYFQLRRIPPTPSNAADPFGRWGVGAFT